MKVNERRPRFAAKYEIRRIRIDSRDGYLRLIDDLYAEVALRHRMDMPNPDFDVERFAELVHAVRF